MRGWQAPHLATWEISYLGDVAEKVMGKIGKSPALTSAIVNYKCKSGNSEMTLCFVDTIIALC